jgi:putative hydrolases of HD superfamily
MSTKPSINRLIEFQKLLLQLRAIDRKILIPPKNQQPENDTEHSYNLAMAVWFLAPHFPQIDTARAVMIALAHDMVEVHAGDTFAFGNEAELSAKQAREAAAQQQLAAEWPDFPALHEAIEEYEDRATEEAKFVYSLDKLMPALLNYIGNGYVWKKHGITFADFQREKERKMPVSPDMYQYYKELLAILDQQPDLFGKPEAA